MPLQTLPVFTKRSQPAEPCPRGITAGRSPPLDGARSVRRAGQRTTATRKIAALWRVAHGVHRALSPREDQPNVGDIAGMRGAYSRSFGDIGLIFRPVR